MSAIQTYVYKIRSYHTDASGKLFIHQLLNFLQDAAHSHADGSGFGQKQLTRQGLFWVLSRLTIEISAFPKQGQEIELSTWVKYIRGSISEREFSMALDGQILVNASSLWFCLSDQSHKPTSLPAEFSSLMEINDSYATTAGSEKVGESAAQIERSKGMFATAHHSDIDMVDHVNNATYARWMMDEILVEYLQKSVLEKIQINYLGECFLGDEVAVSHILVKESDLLHEVMNIDTQQVICRMHTIWLK
jgi:acyl-ACP thioesterase